MGDRSRIEWTDFTLNIVTGCTKVSEGCRNCYITKTPPFRIEGRTFDSAEIGGTTGVRLHPERLALPLRMRKPRRIFVNSLADLFHDEVPDELIAQLFVVMALTPQHTYQILTKRPARMRALLSSGERWRNLLREADTWACVLYLPLPAERFLAVRQWIHGTGIHTDPVAPLSNVWLGVSTEDQATADLRIPKLLETPAAVRFISAEPLLGPVDLHGPIVNGHRPKLTYWLTGRPGWGPEQREPSGLIMRDLVVGPKLDWVIAGGESGPKARPMHPDWARTLRDQCAETGTPFHFKQWGEWAPESVSATERGAASALYLEPDGATRPAARGARGTAITIQRNGKKAAGRKLDGRTWDQFPERVA